MTIQLVLVETSMEVRLGVISSGGADGGGLVRKVAVVWGQCGGGGRSWQGRGCLWRLQGMTEVWSLV